MGELRELTMHGGSEEGSIKNGKAGGLVMMGYACSC